MTRTVLITGATSGIGQQLLKYYYNQNYIVIAVCRSRKKFINLKKVMGNRIFFAYVDLSKMTTVINFVKKIKKIYTSLDLCIFNAGIAKRSDILTEDNMDPIFQINFFSQAYISFNLLKITKKIVFISSDCFKRTHKKDIIDKSINSYTFYSYPTSKFLLILWADFLKSFGNKQIIALNPGIVSTNIWSSVLESGDPISFIKKIFYYFSKKLSPKESVKILTDVIENKKFLKAYYDPHSNHFTDSTEIISKSEIKKTVHQILNHFKYFYKFYEKGSIYFYKQNDSSEDLLYKLILLLLIFYIIKNLICSLKLVQLNNLIR